MIEIEKTKTCGSLEDLTPRDKKTGKVIPLCSLKKLKEKLKEIFKGEQYPKFNTFEEAFKNSIYFKEDYSLKDFESFLTVLSNLTVRKISSYFYNTKTYYLYQDLTNPNNEIIQCHDKIYCIIGIKKDNESLKVTIPFYNENKLFEYIKEVIEYEEEFEEKIKKFK